jgi:hypothetical protein
VNQPLRKWPPYARLIDAESDLVMIYCGEKAWNLAKAGPAMEPGKPSVADPLGVLGSCKFRDTEFERVPSIVFPRRSDPESYRWPVQGKHVFIFAREEPRTATDPLVMELLHQGAIYVGVWANDTLTDYDLRQRACTP